MAKRRLKLYVWENVLTDYYPGIMFALAESEEKARELLLKDHPLLKFNYEDVAKKPDVYDNVPVSFAVSGGG